MFVSLTVFDLSPLNNNYVQAFKNAISYTEKQHTSENNMCSGLNLGQTDDIHIVCTFDTLVFRVYIVITQAGVPYGMWPSGIMSLPVPIFAIRTA